MWCLFSFCLILRYQDSGSSHIYKNRNWDVAHLIGCRNGRAFTPRWLKVHAACSLDGLQTDPQRPLAGAQPRCLMRDPPLLQYYGAVCTRNTRASSSSSGEDPTWGFTINGQRNRLGSLDALHCARRAHVRQSGDKMSNILLSSLKRPRRFSAKRHRAVEADYCTSILVWMGDYIIPSGWVSWCRRNQVCNANPGCGKCAQNTSTTMIELFTLFDSFVILSPTCVI